MRVILIITAITLVTAIAGCGTARKNKAAASEPAPVVSADQPSQDERFRRLHLSVMQPFPVNPGMRMKLPDMSGTSVMPQPGSWET